MPRYVTRLTKDVTVPPCISLTTLALQARLLSFYTHIKGSMAQKRKASTSRAAKKSKTTKVRLNHAFAR